MSSMRFGPRAHLEGTLELAAVFARLSGDHPAIPEVLGLLPSPRELPASVPDADNALKCDAYITRSDTRSAWGLTINDRWQGDALFERVAELARGWGYDLGSFLRLREAFAGPEINVTAAFAFEDAGSPPRLKLYLQEDRWDRGLCRAAELSGKLPRGCELPGWLPADAPVGVVTLQWAAGVDESAKLYLGAASPGAAADHAPDEARQLAVAMATACPLAPAWYYLTIRLGAGGGERTAINKIYNAVHDRRTLQAWRDVAALFDRAGQRPALVDLLRELEPLRGLHVAPTATALEDNGKSADVYCAAWKE